MPAMTGGCGRSVYEQLDQIQSSSALPTENKNSIKSNIYETIDAIFQDLTPSSKTLPMHAIIREETSDRGPFDQKQMEAIYFIPTPGTPEELDKLLREMTVTFEEVARAAGLK